MPAMEVTETGTNTMPIPRPSAARAGRMSVARCAPASAVESHREAATVMSSPMVAMTRGESAALGRAGTIRVVEAIPTTFDLRVAAGEVLTVHDLRPPTAGQFQFGGKCPEGGIAELDRDGRFPTPRASAGQDAPNLRADQGPRA